MTKEELLRPRFMVEKDYPFSEFKVGTVIEFDKKSEAFTGTPEWMTRPIPRRYSGGRASYCIKMFEPFPEVFRSMPWYEGRKPEDMPEYMIVIQDRINHNDGYKGFVFKTEPGSFNRFHSTGFRCHNSNFVTGFDNIIIECFKPATKEEYDQYLLTVNNK